MTDEEYMDFILMLHKSMQKAGSEATCKEIEKLLAGEEADEEVVGIIREMAKGHDHD